MTDAPPPAPPKQRVLLVEDEQYIRDVYRDVLVEGGYEVDEAADGEAALGHIRKGGYTVILLDIMLPKYDGIQILKDMQAQKSEQPNGPVIILSNLEQQTVVAEGVRLGARSYLIKSNITPQDIIAEIQRTLAG